MPRAKRKDDEAAEAKPSPKPRHRQHHLPLHSQDRKIACVCFAFGLVALALWIGRDFLTPLAWAVILAIAVWPLYARLADVTATPMGVTLFAPIALATQEIARESEQIMQWITSLRETGIPVCLPGWPSSQSRVSRSSAGGIPTWRIRKRLDHGSQDSI